MNVLTRVPAYNATSFPHEPATPQGYTEPAFDLGEVAELVQLVEGGGILILGIRLQIDELQLPPTFDTDEPLYFELVGLRDHWYGEKSRRRVHYRYKVSIWRNRFLVEVCDGLFRTLSASYPTTAAELRRTLECLVADCRRL